MATGLPSPPFYEVPNLNNLRDAALACGGLWTKDGKKVREGVLFRSAEISKVDEDGWRRLHDIGVAHVFDLRSKQEVDKGRSAGMTDDQDKGAEDSVADWETCMKSAGVQRTWVPVFKEASYSPEQLAIRYMKYLDEAVEGFVSAYHDILTDGGPAFRTIVLYLASLPPPSTFPQPQSIGALIHCTAGKDRTGIFFGLLLSFLGVSDEQIADEYQLTEPGLKHIYEAFVPLLMASAPYELYKSEKLQGASEEDGRNAARRMLGAKQESMLAALAMLRREWGSAERYLREVCGLGDGELEAVRMNLVVDV